MNRTLGSAFIGIVLIAVACASETSGASSTAGAPAQGGAAAGLSEVELEASAICSAVDRSGLDAFDSGLMDAQERGIDFVELMRAIVDTCGDVIGALIDEEEAADGAEPAPQQDQQAAEQTESEQAEGGEREAQEQPAQVDAALLRCYEQYNSARYLSAQALQASTCIVDKLFFGGVRPTEANTSQLMPEMLFHATWATWDAATRATYCSDVKRRGFDAAETIGMAMSRTWQGQIRAAGSSWYLDDYGLVLDVLDTCEEY